jgi:hypothetical protein
VKVLSICIVVLALVLAYVGMKEPPEPREGEVSAASRPAERRTVKMPSLQAAPPKPPMSAASRHGDRNVLVNPGFEVEGPAGWINQNRGALSGIHWNTPDQKHGGQASLRLTADRINPWEVMGAKQLLRVRPGNVISGGAWLRYENLENAALGVECKWLDARQNELGGGIGTLRRTQGSADWAYQDLNTRTIEERTAPLGAFYVDFRLTLLSSGNADTATGTAWWDDAWFWIENK